jgi:hypothetical protein
LRREESRGSDEDEEEDVDAKERLKRDVGNEESTDTSFPRRLISVDG